MPDSVKLDLLATLALNAANFFNGLNKADAAAAAAAKKFAGYFGNLAAPLATIGPAIAAAFTGGAIVSGVGGVFSMARGLEEISEQTGIGVGRISMLGKAFRAAGLEAEDVGTVVNRLQKFIVNASETGAGGDILARLGTSALALRQMAPEQQLQTVGQAISHIRDPAERSRIAMELLGKSGGRLLGVFNSEAFAKAGGPLTGSAKILEENADLFTRASIGLGKVGGIFRSFYLGIAEKVAGPFVAIMDALEKVNLVTLGEAFGDAVVAGATAFVEMLLAIKKSGFVPSMKTVTDGLAWAGEVFRDFLAEGAKFIADSVEEARKIAQFLGFDTSGWSKPSTPEPSKPRPRPDAAGSSGSDGEPPDRTVITGSAWRSALDDTSETGRRMWQRRAGNVGDPGNGVEGAFGGLSGSGADPAEAARQRLKTIRDQVRFQDPHLAGAALENAVRAADKKQREDEETRKYRELHGSPLGDDKTSKDPATEGGQKNIATAVGKLSEKLELLFAQ